MITSIQKKQGKQLIPSQQPAPQPDLQSILWSQIKISSKNISRRSYHSSAIHNNKHYVFGGYDINTGIMSDFHCIDLNQPNAEWQTLNECGQGYPGKRYAHSAVVYDNKMVVFGGKMCSLNNTNRLNWYHFQREKWEEKKTMGCVVPEIDSHTACVHRDNMIVFGGFLGGNIGKYSNTIYILDLVKLEWKQLDTPKCSPAPRANTSSCVLHDKMFLFGGSDLNHKFRDLWSLDLATFKWEQIPCTQPQSQIPESRDGHTMVVYKDRLILFGGIHDITHQKNDIAVFHQNKWRVIEEKQRNVEVAFEENEQAVAAHNKKAEESLAKETTKNKKYRQLREINYMNNHTGPTHPEKEQKSKQDIRKQHLLSEFELTPEEKERFRNPSPTLESLKNSIMSINGNNPFKKQLSHDYELLALKKTNQKKKPCARDGHSACLYNDHLIIFGGDRHMMGFNDMFSLDLSKLT